MGLQGVVQRAGCGRRGWRSRGPPHDHHRRLRSSRSSRLVRMLRGVPRRAYRGGEVGVSGVHERRGEKREDRRPSSICEGCGWGEKHCRREACNFSMPRRDRLSAKSRLEFPCTLSAWRAGIPLGVRRALRYHGYCLPRRRLYCPTL
ncbi:hypothetical protein E2C01_042598 [Portunus trituberculatus]|uniref:Uncharacterized protein n=1 Tax=Portunus trituberculatus TaxID=210409 RepID=A0A5B7FU07_PORTR|nr:hypothetical protein [Portunus trituberculatus]